MKTLKLIVVAMCVSVLTLLLFAGQCGVPVETSVSYDIKFKVDGVQKNFDKGLTNYVSEPFGHPITGSPDYTQVLATPDVETGESLPDNGIMIYFIGTTTGIYTDANAMIEYGEGEWYVTDGNPVTVTITKYENEGGVIEGTFSGTVSFTLSDKVITEGEFTVKRVAKDLFVP